MKDLIIHEYGRQPDRRFEWFCFEESNEVDTPTFEDLAGHEKKYNYERGCLEYICHNKLKILRDDYNSI